MDSVLGPRASGFETIENAYSVRHSDSEIKPLISGEEWTKTDTDSSSTGYYGSTNTIDVNNKNDTCTITESIGGGSDRNVIQDDDNDDSDGSFFAEIPAIIVTLMINFMTAIPFGVAYFPLGWSGSGDGDGDTTTDDAAAEDGISGSFPLPGM